ncbi:DUF4262 domain-containing protein [Cellulomonas hominis]|uniref:DUF4262 domain-containing protein n=1 Tax=Cellulomonas hominis TaxID=156981 RepID=UPI001BA2451E|nr:DUF4262 domain-containing protein [Cellulomonas hominis]VTR76615.1 hypothetical protein CHMI_01376 [Cellulomonas hominis]
MRTHEDHALRGEIELYGWALQYVVGARLATSFGYTAGLHLRDLPELVDAGLPPEQAWLVLDDVAGRATAGLALDDGAVVGDLPLGLHARLVAVEDTTELHRARALTGSPDRLRALHLDLSVA